ncbi:hypothetical protein AB3X94_37205 [Paraburkholderia sp. BR10923]|uniref:phage baseplate plug family protein n=1 Tax=Paraburkholderia sp. BR10923 TaxID=3236992 RepID=UPI0034CE6543
MTVRFNGEILQFTIVWNSVGQHWYANILDVSTGQWIAQYMPLVVGIPLGQRLGRAWVLLLLDASAAFLDPMSVDDMGKRCVLAIDTLESVLATIAAELGQ